MIRGEASKADACSFIQQLQPGKWKVHISEFKPTRSHEQNNRYWAIVQDISEQVETEGKKYSPEIWHEYFKREFIGREELPNGEVRGKSSTRLNVIEFSEFMNHVEVFAVEHGVRFYESLKESA